MRIRGITAVTHLADAVLFGYLGVVFVFITLPGLAPMTGAIAVEVTTTQMAPAIPRDAMIFADPIGPGGVTVDDIVVLRTDTSHIGLRRVVRVVNQGGHLNLEVKADGLPANDPFLIPEQQVLGKVTTVLPVLGKVRAWATQPAGIAVLVLIALVLLVGLWLLDDVAYRRALRELRSRIHQINQIRGRDAANRLELAEAGQALPDRPDDLGFFSSRGLRALRLGERFSSILLYALVVLVGLVMVLPALAPLAGREVIVLESGSMSPAWPTGSLVVVVIDQHVDRATIRVGDVVTYRTENGLLITHRVVAIDGAGASRQFTTKGDANDHPDPQPIPTARIVGRADFGLPYLGSVRAFLASLTGIAIILMLAGALIVLADIFGDSAAAMRRRIVLRRLEQDASDAVAESDAALCALSGEVPR